MLKLVQDRREQVAHLCRRFGVRRLEVFGSAATSEGFDPGRSDLDFLVEFHPLPEGKRADAYFGLLEGLQELFDRPIDLVVVGAIRNPYFRQAIEPQREVLYAP